MDVILHFILPFFGILLALLVIHEAGHYFTAKLFGVKVLEAGIGMPPRIWGFRWRGTDYTLNAIPMGAFVRMLGEEDPAAKPDPARDPAEARGTTLAELPKWKRTIIIGAGAMMNLILAIALFSVSLMVPKQVSDGGATIADVAPGSPAEQAGLQPGDQIIEINGRHAESRQDASYFIHLGQGSTIDFTIKRTDPRAGAETLEIPVYARWDPPSYTDECGIERAQGPTGIALTSPRGQNVPLTPEERADLEPRAKEAYAQHKARVATGAPAPCLSGAPFGFVPLSATECGDLDAGARARAEALKAELFAESAAPCYQFQPGQGFAEFTKTRSEPIWDAIPQGTRLAFESLILTRNLIWTKIRGFDNANDSPITGPVGIAQATGEVVEEAGWLYLIEFGASISMSLAILNFMPLPAVDGGRLFFILIEALRGGRRVAPQKEALVHFVGLAALFMLFLVITYFDVLRIVNGDSLLR